MMISDKTIEWSGSLLGLLGAFLLAITPNFWMRIRCLRPETGCLGPANDADLHMRGILNLQLLVVEMLTRQLAIGLQPAPPEIL